MGYHAQLVEKHKRLLNGNRPPIFGLEIGFIMHHVEDEAEANGLDWD